MGRRCWCRRGVFKTTGFVGPKCCCSPGSRQRDQRAAEVLICQRARAPFQVHWRIRSWREEGPKHPENSELGLFWTWGSSTFLDHFRDPPTVPIFAEVMQVFERAAAAAPAVIFFDEIEAFSTEQLAEIEEVGTPMTVKHLETRIFLS